MQSTYCSTIKEHCDTVGRSVHVANLGARHGVQADRAMTCTKSGQCVKHGCTYRCAAYVDFE